MAYNYSDVSNILSNADITNQYLGNQTLGQYQDSNAGQVDKLYDEILGRNPDKAGMDYWTNLLNTGTSLADVSNAIRSSQEASDYQNYMSTKPVYEMGDIQGAGQMLTDMARRGYGAPQNVIDSTINLVGSGYTSTTSPTPQTATQQQQQGGLTVDDLNNWWKQQQAATENGVTSSQSGLSTLYPRVNWGNYQTSGRGGRYFDPTSGKYNSMGNLYQTTTASM